MKRGRHLNRAIRFALLLAFISLPAWRPLQAHDLIVCVGLALGGMFWRVWASGHLDKGLRVCDTGPYALSRHPLYLGTMLIALGYTKLWFDWSLTAAWAGALLLVEIWRALLEEARLTERFGGDYGRYRARVPGLLPTPASLVRGLRSLRGFDFVRVWKNGDVYRTLAIFAGVLLVWRADAVHWILILTALIVGYVAGRGLKDGLRGIPKLHLQWRTAYDLGREIWNRAA